MSCQRGDLRHARVSPHDDLIQRVSVGTNDLVDVLRPHEVTHLFSNKQQTEEMSKHAFRSKVRTLKGQYKAISTCKTGVPAIHQDDVAAIATGVPQSALPVFLAFSRNFHETKL